MAVAAKGKKRRSEREEDARLENKVPVRQKPSQNPADARVRGGDVRGVVEETLARVYGELFTSTNTHDELGNVDIEIKEQAYILTLHMFVGTDDYQPRRGLSIREDEKVGNSARFCKEHS